MTRPRQLILGPSDPRNPIRRRRHGFTADELDAARAAGCAICGRKDVPLQVDHWHGHCPGSEGCRVCARGLLCGNDNSILRWIADSAAHAEAIAAYLRRTTPQ